VIASWRVETGQRYRIVVRGGVPMIRVYMPWHGGVEHAGIKSIAGRSDDQRALRAGA
jgi:hypothetical protein